MRISNERFIELIEQEAFKVIEQNTKVLLECYTDLEQKIVISLEKGSELSYLEQFKNYVDDFSAKDHNYSTFIIEKTTTIERITDIYEYVNWVNSILRIIQNDGVDHADIQIGDEDDRALYLIYTTDEHKSTSAHRLVGVTDNESRLAKSVVELLKSYTIGESGENYDIAKYKDVSYLNTIPYLFVQKTTLNHVETGGSYL